MKYELDNFTPRSFTIVNSALLLLLPTKFFRLAIGGTALNVNDTKSFVQTVLQLANYS